ncbi:MAG: ABC transporter ATP-binding protein [Chloroflexi bacterium]|nr:ABC transporter ATP-binding protein [Chloroflexota bacterium]
MFLTLDHITKKFPGRGQEGIVSAVEDLSLEIGKGEFFTFLGPSGCGKTTTLRLIAGFEFPTSGHIALAERQLEQVPPNKRDMAMVFQSYAIFPHLKVFENIAYGLRIKKLSNDEIRRRVSQIMALTKLTGLENRMPNQMSGGQQQRVSLARALVVEPKVLLFDEPLSNLDAKLREEMRFEIRDLQRRLNITSIYVTHDQEEALALSDRIAIMNKGKLAQLGTPEEIYERPRSKFVADFIGLANFLPAQVQTIQDGRATVQVGAHTLQVTALPNDTAGHASLVFVRPGDIKLVDDRTQANILEGQIIKATYLGEKFDYRVRVGDLELRVQASEGKRHAAGERVHLYLPPEHARLIGEE